MISLKNIRNIYFTIVIFSEFLVITINGKDCKETPELRRILQKYIHGTTSLSELEGTWMDVYVASEDVAELDASYSTITRESNHDRSLNVISKERVKQSNKEVSYNEKIQLGENPGTFLWAGKYDSYLVDASIMVNALKKNELQEDGDNVVKSSFKKAHDKLEEIRAKGDDWEKDHDGEFGLLDDMIIMEFNKLKP